MGADEAERQLRNWERNLSVELEMDPMQLIDRLPLRNPAEMRDLYAIKIGEIIDYLVELGAALDLSKNEYMQEALERSSSSKNRTLARQAAAKAAKVPPPAPAVAAPAPRRAARAS